MNYLDNTTISARNVKLEQVKKFIKENCYLAPQGSEEWLKTRQSIIGGSELSILSGDNPFSSISDLVATKCGLSKFTSNVATKWGNIFEELTRIIVQMIFLNDIPLSEECIYETGSLEGVIPHHRFSPDGLTVIICKKYDGSLQPVIVLLEFKSPLSSIPTKIVPKYYLPQVKAGMCDIEMVELGLFVNNMFRKCKLEQFGNNPEYNKEFHMSDIKKKVNISEPLAIGILGLYQTKEQRKKFIELINKNNQSSDSSDDEDIYEPNIETKLISSSLIDIGKLNQDETLIIFQHICNKYFTIKYYSPNIYTTRLVPNLPQDILYYPQDIISFKMYETNPKKFINKFEKKYYDMGLYPVGFLPWKLFMADFILVDKDPLYIYQFVPKIEEVINIITNICSTNNMEERQIKFNDYFPSK
jgi:hypothetical protein